MPKKDDAIPPKIASFEDLKALMAIYGSSDPKVLVGKKICFKVPKEDE